ncbi:MAG: hypothetical protein ACRC7S_17370 [Cetobacterium sp.]
MGKRHRTHVVGSWHWLKVLVVRFTAMTMAGGYQNPTALLGYYN